MSGERDYVGNVLELDRTPVSLESEQCYARIGIRSFGKGIFHYEPELAAELPTVRYYKIKAGCLVISNIKGWEGAIAVSSSADEQCLASNRFLPYRPIDGDRLDVRWTYWYFLSEPGNKLVQQASPGSADRNRTLAIDRFEALEIPLPPIDEQRRVANHLDRIAATISLLQKEISRRAALHTALTVSLASRPDLDIPTKERRGWRLKEFGEVLAPGAVPVAVEASKSYPNFGIYSFGRGLFKKPDIDGSATSAKTLYRVSAGQFIYSRLFAFEGAYATVPAEFNNYYVSGEFPAFDADPDRLEPKWLAAYLRSSEHWAELAASSKGLGVRRQRVTATALLAYRVLLPPIELQRRTIELLAQLGNAECLHVEGGRETPHLSSLLPATLNKMFGQLS